MKTRHNSLIQKYLNIWDAGKLFFKDNPKIGFFLQTFSVNAIFADYSQKKDALEPSDKKTFENMIKELKDLKKIINPEHNKCSQEDYLEFLSNIFANVEDCDRKGEVTIKTSLMFKLVGDLIYPLSQFSQISDSWKKRLKYCKFKAVDIQKALSKGEIPKRGGPKEEEEGNKKNDQKENEKIERNNKDEESQQDTNCSKALHDESSSSEQTKVNPGIEEIPSTSTSTSPLEFTFRHSLTVNEEEVKCEVHNINLLTRSQEDFYKKAKETLKKVDNCSNSRAVSPIPTSRLHLENEAVKKKNRPEKERKNQAQYGHSVKPDIVNANDICGKPFSIHLPVQFRSKEYFKFINIIKDNTKSSLREFQSGKIQKSLSILNTSYDYINSITKQ